MSVAGWPSGRAWAQWFLPVPSSAPADQAASPAEASAGGGTESSSPVQVPALGDLKPTLVSLHYTQAPLQEVVADLSKQAGVPITGYRGFWSQLRGKSVTIDVDSRPFWEVLCQIGSQVGFEVPQYGGQQIRLEAASPERFGRPQYTAGPFTVIANDLQYTRHVDLGGGQNPATSFHLSMTILIDPGMHLLAWSIEPVLTQATDDQGNSLLASPRNGGRSRWHAGNGDYTCVMQARLAYPQKPGTRITQLKGSAGCLLATKSETWQLDNLVDLQGVSKTIDGNTYQVTQVQQQGQKWIVKISAPRDPLRIAKLAPGVDSFSLQRSLRLIDSSGRRWHMSGSRGRGRGNAGWDFEVEFSQFGDDPDGPPGDPVKLLWEIPTEIQQVEVPFEFADLPLP